MSTIPGTAPYPKSIIVIGITYLIPFQPNSHYLPLSYRLMVVSCMLFAAWCSFAQKPLYSNHQLYTTEDGLPQNYVSSIVQDRDGFIWVATLDGLARFDGKNFIEFNITSDSNRKISTPRVLDLKIDEQNKLEISNNSLTS